MDKKVQLSGKFKMIMYVMIALGVISVIAGFYTENGTRAWANLLLNNYYFLSVAMGALFWMAIQAVTQSGWSAAYLRIPQAMSNYLIVSFVLFAFMFFGLHDLYHWSHADAVSADPLLQHKEPYLNIPFFALRYILFFGLWIFLTFRIKSLSLNEEKIGGLSFFNKIEFNSKVFIFVFAFSFSLFSIDWLMSLDAHWYSTIYVVKKFIMAFFHGVTVIVAIAIILRKLGYLPMLSKEHIANFSRYIFALSIIWAYMWLSQYLLIWYANIPEETIYYIPREMGEYKSLFYTELLVNWAFPFLFLMWNRVAKNENLVLVAVLVLAVGQWVELYMSIMPSLDLKNAISFVEVGTFIGFAGLFGLVTGLSLSKIPLIAKNHPYLIESLAEEH
ncbi:MAG: hypothetical protein WC341_06255 [Bacteroidales bacterium]|jgi:hypothetical protein